MRARPKEPLADWCEAQFDGCGGRATCRHHVMRRGQGGSDDKENTRDLCGWCHLHIHANPEWSFEHGWLRHREAS